jgi:imidazolonepropionase-like amidohydrolase
MGVSGFRLAALALPIALMACANSGKDTPKSASAKPAAKPTVAAKVEAPFASTYKAYTGIPTLIQNVTILDGEGGRIDNGDVLLRDGKIAMVAASITDADVPADANSVDGSGMFVTPGIIDIHSHLGTYPTPSVAAHDDGNEATSPTTPEVWVEHSVWPQDPGFSRALANGGITSLQILPGSANLMGGRTVTLKNVYSRTVQGMKFPGAPYGFKMACGENPKRVYGGKGRMPSTRMGNYAVNRQTWIKAQEYKKKRDGGKEFTRDIGMETLAGVLDGDILVHNHCYRADEMAQVLDMAKEFGYKVSTFHHAVESYKIADLLKANDVCSAVWADWWSFKMEAYDAIPENAALINNAGACTIIHSDDQNQIQRLNQEAAKAIADGRRMGLTITDADAMRWLTINPAKAMGIDKMTGSLKPGKMADVVLWNGNPFSVYSRPAKVWIDGALLYDSSNPALRPVSDFELGQPGSGDVK